MKLIEPLRRVMRQLSSRLEGYLALIFGLLGLMLMLVVASHWFLVLEPTLRAEAESRATVLAQSQIQSLERLLDEHQDPEHLRRELESALGSILLFKDDATQEHFIQRIKLAFDYDLFRVPSGHLDLDIGSAACDQCFVARIPLYHPRDGLLIGVATCYSSPRFLHDLTDNLGNTLVWVAGFILLSIGYAWFLAQRFLGKLKAVQEELRAASFTDPLTGLYNRRYLYQRLSHEIDLACRYRHPLSVILFDLDFFKRVNDTFGHGVGDDVLVCVGGVLKACTREVDVAGRHGGEEFLVILPHADLAEAAEVAERIRASIARVEWSVEGLDLTISGGVAQHCGESLDAFLDIADRWLYMAKKSGRNRVLAAPIGVMPEDLGFSTAER
jgi:diguanylate cyclase (GGDEF)-like protein